MSCSWFKFFICVSAFIMNGLPYVVYWGVVSYNEKKPQFKTDDTRWYLLAQLGFHVAEIFLNYDLLTVSVKAIPIYMAIEGISDAQILTYFLIFEAALTTTLLPKLFVAILKLFCYLKLKKDPRKLEILSSENCFYNVGVDFIHCARRQEDAHWKTEDAGKKKHLDHACLVQNDEVAHFWFSNSLLAKDKCCSEWFYAFSWRFLCVVRISPLEFIRFYICQNSVEYCDPVFMKLMCLPEKIVLHPQDFPLETAMQEIMTTDTSTTNELIEHLQTAEPSAALWESMAQPISVLIHKSDTGVDENVCEFISFLAREYKAGMNPLSKRLLPKLIQAYCNGKKCCYPAACNLVLHTYNAALGKIHLCHSTVRDLVIFTFDTNQVEAQVEAHRSAFTCTTENVAFLSNIIREYPDERIRKNCLLGLKIMTQGGALSSELCESMKQPLMALILDWRPNIVHEVCEFISFLATEYKDQINPLSKPLLTAIVSAYCNGNYTCFDSTAQVLMEHTYHAENVEFLRDKIQTHESNDIRYKCLIYMKIIVEKHWSDLGAREKDKINAIINAEAQDTCANCRQAKEDLKQVYQEASNHDIPAPANIV